jgi:hypothetical protein
MGGINGSDYESSFVPTASFVCETDYSATWGPVFPSYFKNDGNIRGSHPKLEIYLHYSAPNRKLTKVSVAIDNSFPISLTNRRNELHSQHCIHQEHWQHLATDILSGGLVHTSVWFGHQSYFE